LIVLLLVPLLLPSGPVRGQDSFAATRDAYLAKIYVDLNHLDRIALVDQVAEFDSRDAAKLLFESIPLLGEKVDGLLEKLEKVELAHEKVNSNQDIEGDGFKKLDRLRERIRKYDGLLSAERQVMNRILRSVLRFRGESARGVVRLMVVKGKSWRQRGFAARAAAGFKTEAGRKAALKALEDKVAGVLIHALIGFRERKDAETVKPIVACLEHEVWVVQSAAADALAAIGSKKAIRPLIEALPRTRGRVQDDINEALKKLTGESYVPDYEIWKAWYEKHRAELEEEEGKPLAKGKKKKGEGEGTHYYGIKSRSKRIVYVIDISGSMNKEIRGGKAVTAEDGKAPLPSGPKIEIAKSELKSAIRQLPDDAYFNIITFNQIVRRWEKEMLKANQKNKNKAYLFIRKLKAAGSTYTYGALKEAFRLAGMGSRDKNYDSLVDTIFLLSDGAPTDQSFPTAKLMEPEIVLKAVREWNQLRRVVIHAIAIDPQIAGTALIRFMKDLAKQNGGEYRERG
jgi:Mg-chelatase subunit ChlD